jgi:hypothetical protein
MFQAQHALEDPLSSSPGNYDDESCSDGDFFASETQVCFQIAFNSSRLQKNSEHVHIILVV